MRGPPLRQPLLAVLALLALPAAAQDAASLTDLIGTPPDWVGRAPLVAEAFRQAEHRHFSDATDGNSTLTRDLVRMLVLPEVQRIGDDWRLVPTVGKALPARTILNAYLDRIYLGRRCFGIDDGAHFWFGRPPEALDAHQAALLATIARDPHGIARDPDRIRARTAALAGMLARAGTITADEADRIAAAPLPELAQGPDCPAPAR